MLEVIVDMYSELEDFTNMLADRAAGQEIPAVEEQESLNDAFAQLGIS